MPAVYDLNKIKFATDEMTFQRAVELYESGKVTEIKWIRRASMCGKQTCFGWEEPLVRILDARDLQ